MSASREPGARAGASIRAYRDADLEAVLDLFRRSVREVASRDYAPDEIAAWAPDGVDRAAWGERLRSGCTLVCEECGALLGFARGDARGDVDLLYVHPAAQRRGVARALLARLVERARELGRGAIATEASRTARGFFARAGFRVVAAQRVARRGVALENFRMVRDLRPVSTLRPATNADRAAVERLIATALAEYGLRFDPTGTDAELADIEANYAGAGGAFSVLVDESGRVVGSVGVLRRTDAVCELRKMYLEASARGAGEGRRLLEHALEQARARGFRRVVLQTASALREAIALYERYAFRPYVPESLSNRCDAAYALDLDAG